MAVVLENEVAGALRTMASIFQREVDAPLLMALRARRSEVASILGSDPLAGLDLADAAGALESLAVEYCRLFIGPRGHTPPVESVVRGEGRFWGASTESVARVYRTHGLTLSPRAGILPDHVSAELDCLATLEESDQHKPAKVFAQAHLLEWLPRLNQRVSERASLRFYPAWCQGVLAFLEALYA